MKRDTLKRIAMLAMAVSCIIVLGRASCGKVPPPKAVMLIEPANGARVEQGMLMFRWQGLEKIDEYQLEVASDEMFANIMVSQSVMGTTYTPTKKLNDGTYYWHVRARAGKDNWGAWTEYAWSFELYTPKAAEPALSLATIHFDFDKYDIRKGDAATLEGNAKTLKDAADMGFKPPVMIEGHCDPVGTAEYNMALGQRRAEAAKSFLVKMGVPESQLMTISYGEEKLVTTDEAMYEQSRRAEFKPERSK
jgi:outer membrane protein OmpA-like peptidoglycan-associated protein